MADRQQSDTLVAERPQATQAPAKPREAGPRLRPTRNDLPAEVRQRVLVSANRILAGSIDLVYQAKQAHWNVKGPSFVGLHALFDEIATQAEAAVDLVAERVVQLGGIAEGTVRVAAGRSELQEYPLGAVSGREHVEALSNALATYGARVRAAIDEAADHGDADTADIYTEISRAIDKHLWMLEAHLEGGT